MARIPFRDAGAVGIFKTDANPTELPLNAWSDAKNVRLRNGYVERMLGHAAVFQQELPVQAQFALFVPADTAYYWLFPGASNVWRTDGSHTVDVTPTGGITGRQGNWTGVMFSRWPILNDGVDYPLTWDITSPTAPMFVLPAWPTGYTARIFTAYRNYLIALGVTAGGVLNPRLVKWSAAAPAGALPVTWDYTDPTHDAGQYDLAETGDVILDAATMGNSLMIYKQNNVWGMLWVGGEPVFDFAPVFRNRGILSKNCCVEFQTGLHAVFGDNDLYVHDGNTVTSLVTGTMRDWLYASLDNQNFANSFVSLNTQFKEVWFCFPTIGNVLPNLAMVWNYETSKIGFRDLPNASFIARGVVDPGATSGVWSAALRPWAGDIKPWNALRYNPTQYRDLMTVPSVPKGTYLLDYTNTFAGVAPIAYVERVGMGIPTRDGGPPDLSSRKLITRMWPRLNGTMGAQFTISLGTMDSADGAPQWLDSWPYSIGQNPPFIDPLVDVNLLCVRVYNNDGNTWRMSGYELEVVKSGSTGL